MKTNIHFNRISLSFSYKSNTENENTRVMFNNIFLKIVSFMR
jgi:hypothetical protein